MLKTIILKLSKGRDLKTYPDLLLSLKSNSIEVISLGHNNLEATPLLAYINEASLIIKDCLLITDCQQTAHEAKSLHLACIGISSLEGGFFSGASCIIDSIKYLQYDSVLEEYNRFYNLPSTITCTNRLIIRELTVTEIEAMYQLYEDKEYVKFLPPLLSLEKEMEKHASYIKHVYNFYRYGLWGVFLQNTDKLIGRCGLQSIELDGSSEVELAYLIDSAYSQMGYGYEATSKILEIAREKFYLTSVIVRIHKDNQPSIRLAEKLGFHYEKPLPDEEQLLYRIDFRR